MKLIIFGPPGSGKGTQAKFLSENLNLKHFSTGEIFRDEYNKKTKLGIEAYNKYWGKGNLCPDKITNEIVKKNLPKDNYIIDGYPRTIDQAKFLDILSKPNIIIVLDVPFHTLKSRLLKRAIIEKRDDDNIETIKIRFKSYREQTAPLLKYYKDKIIIIEGDREINQIRKDIVNAVKNADRNFKIKS